MEIEQIKQITIIGLGRMGHGIAQTFAMAGYRVCGFDESSDARQNVHSRIRCNLDAFVANGLLNEAEVDPILGHIEIFDRESQAASDAQFIVEAIAEELTAKQEFFTRIEEAVKEETIIASNSSTFMISESSKNMRRPQRAIVTHWFNPPHIVPIVEVVPSPDTSEEVTKITIALHKKIGKLPVRINREIPGFLANRVQFAMIREVWDLYERGIASKEDIDTAICGSLGFRLAVCGPLTICDFGGIDIWSTIYKELAPDLRHDAEVPEVIQKLADTGRIGASVGAGIHDYDPGIVGEITSQRDEAMLKLAKLFYDKNSQPEGDSP